MGNALDHMTCQELSKPEQAVPDQNCTGVISRAGGRTKSGRNGLGSDTGIKTEGVEVRDGNMVNLCDTTQVKVRDHRTGRRRCRQPQRRRKTELVDAKGRTPEGGAKRSQRADTHRRGRRRAARVEARKTNGGRYRKPDMSGINVSTAGDPRELKAERKTPGAKTSRMSKGSTMNEAKIIRQPESRNNPGNQEKRRIGESKYEVTGGWTGGNRRFDPEVTGGCNRSNDRMPKTTGVYNTSGGKGGGICEAFPGAENLRGRRTKRGNAEVPWESGGTAGKRRFPRNAEVDVEEMHEYWKFAEVAREHEGSVVTPSMVIGEPMQRSAEYARNMTSFRRFRQDAEQEHLPEAEEHNQKGSGPGRKSTGSRKGSESKEDRTVGINLKVTTRNRGDSGSGPEVRHERGNNPGGQDRKGSVTGSGPRLGGSSEGNLRGNNQKGSGSGSGPEVR
ncbi:hypothetical protein B0H12DRAFT_1227253 [Mycena haematopus]|nr:hypothetical protein B0H12DRAFT_1227253 [Mycena haematopus]